MCDLCVSMPPAMHHFTWLSRNCEDQEGPTDDVTTSFLHFPPFSTALWDLANSRPVHFLMLSSHLFLCLPCLLPPFTVLCKPHRVNGRHVHITAVSVSLRWSGGLRVVRLPAGSWLSFWLIRRTKHGLKARKYYIALRFFSGIVVLFSPFPAYSMTGIS